MNPDDRRLEQSTVAMAEIAAAERELLLSEFDKLKQKRDGELRVSTRRNARTGIVEIIYIGVHEKGDLTTVRELYARAARSQVTF